MQAIQLKNFKSHNNKYCRIWTRVLVISLTFIIYYITITYILPDSIIGINNVKYAICNVYDHNHPDWSLGKTLFKSTGGTFIRFGISILYVFSTSIFLLLILKWSKVGRGFLDHFSESLRTVPATVWAFPIAILTSSINSIYVSTVLSTSPILTLGFLELITQIRDSNAFKLSQRNGVSASKVFNFKFIPWLIKNTIVSIKTTISLIFIIVIVLESILTGKYVSYGLGVIMGDLWLNLTDKGVFSAELFLLFMLSFISVIISSIIDFVNVQTK